MIVLIILGTKEVRVLISGVVYKHLYVAGKVCSVLIKEVSLFQG